MKSYLANFEPSARGSLPPSPLPPTRASLLSPSPPLPRPPLPRAAGWSAPEPVVVRRGAAVMVQRITQELLLASTSYAKSSARTSRKDHILARQTHLSLNGKRIKHIEGLGVCSALLVLYLFDNQIEVLDGLQDVPNLTHLYLQHNDIHEVHDLSSLGRLQKLYLNGNCLSSLEPFAVLGPTLVELHVGSQRPYDGHLCLPPAALAQMHKLRVLTIPNNNLTDISPLRELRALEVLEASRNRIEALASVLPVLSDCTLLSDLDLRDNPVASMRQLMDSVIVSGEALQVSEQAAVQ